MLMVRGPKQVTLVDRANAAKVFTRNNVENGGMADVIVSDWDGHSERVVTNAIGAGSLSAYIQGRDDICPTLINKNNQMAAGVISSINEVHRNGFGLKDFSEVTGRDFFAPVGDINQAAAQMQLTDVIAQSTDAISAGSSPNAPGDNVILNQMLNLKDQKILDGGNANFIEFYSNMIGELGVEAARATHVKDADQILLSDLNSRREAVSGVSLDEEAMEIMKWQANFTAASKVITTVDEMLETVLSLKR